MQGPTIEQVERTAGCAGDEQMRARVHGMWSAVASSWGEHADYVDSRGSEVTARMLELAGLRPGARVLELACGPGNLGLAAAERVLPHGDVVLSDVVPEMASDCATSAPGCSTSSRSTSPPRLTTWCCVARG
jgi:predicted methyltransferase